MLNNLMLGLFFLGIYDESMKINKDNIKYFLWIKGKEIKFGEEALNKAKKFFDFDFNSTISKFSKPGYGNLSKGSFFRKNKTFFYLSNCTKKTCFQLIIQDDKLKRLSQLPNNLSILVQNYKKMIDNSNNKKDIIQYILNNLKF